MVELPGLAGVLKVKMLHVELFPLVGHHEDYQEMMEKEEWKKRSEGVRVHGRPRSTHIYGYT